LMEARTEVASRKLGLCQLTFWRAVESL